MDLHDLRDEAKALIARKAELEGERSLLEVNLKDLETEASTLKSQISVLVTTADVKECVQGALASKPTGDLNISRNRRSVADPKYSTKDAKLELQLLSSEMQSIMHKLDLQAKEWETKVEEVGSKLQKLEATAAKIPRRFTQSIDELEQDVAALVEEHAQMKILTDTEAKRVRSEKAALTASINQIRASTLTLCEDTSLMRDDGVRWRASVEGVVAKCEILRKHANETTKLLSECVEGGWQRVAFAEATHTPMHTTTHEDDVRIHINDVADSIAPYFPPTFAEVSHEAVRTAVTSLYGDGRADQGLTYVQFCAVCEHMTLQPQKPEMEDFVLDDDDD